jgi:hypothetical protein
MTLLHIHTESRGILSFLESVFWHGFLDTIYIIPFLFLTYILMELIEHKASGKTKGFLEKSKLAGPIVGGALGILPQCGFSAAAANFYTSRVITLGTLVAVFLSTSDEMLPILISGKLPFGKIASILLYKALVAIAIGFIIDLVMRLMHRGRDEINIDAICDEDGCNCENGIIRSALHHTFTIGAFIFIITVLINTLVYFVGEEAITKILYDRPIISHIIAAFIGLIPNCAISVALTNFALSGFITFGTMLSGLFTGAGVGLLVLFRINKNVKENLVITATVFLIGAIFGYIADVIPIFR